MTINEAIVQVKEIAKEKRNEIYTFGMHCNPKITKDLGMYEQLAEWLEELKKYQSYKPVDKEFYKAGYTKAIDDFAEALKSDEFQKYNIDMVFETSRDLTYTQCTDAFCEYIDIIAEQLKEGSADNE